MALTRSQDPWLLPVLRVANSRFGSLKSENHPTGYPAPDPHSTSQVTPMKQTPHALGVGHIRPNPEVSTSQTKMGWTPKQGPGLTTRAKRVPIFSSAWRMRCKAAEILTYCRGKARTRSPGHMAHRSGSTARKNDWDKEALNSSWIIW